MYIKEIRNIVEVGLTRYHDGIIEGLCDALCDQLVRCVVRTER